MTKTIAFLTLIMPSPVLVVLSLPHWVDDSTFALVDTALKTIEGETSEHKMLCNENTL